MITKTELKLEMPILYNFLLHEDIVLDYLKSLTLRDIDYVIERYSTDRNNIMVYSDWSNDTSYWAGVSTRWRTYDEQNT